MRRCVVVIAAALAATIALAAPARAQPVPDVHDVWLVAMPEDEVRAWIAAGPGKAEMGVALGVLPASDEPAAFLREVGFSGPAEISVPSAQGDYLRTPLRDLLGNKYFGAGVGSSMAGDPLATLANAFEAPRDRVPLDVVARGTDQPGSLSVLVLRHAEDLELLRTQFAREDTVFLVIGVSTDVPVLVVLTGRGVGLLGGGSTRRPGIVTPYDIAASVVAEVFPRDGRQAAIAAVSGGYLYGVGGPDPLARLDRLEARFERDLGVGRPLTIATVAFGLAGLAFGALALVSGLPRAAGAMFRGAAMAPAGYVGALFVPDGRWQVRATAIAGAFVFGLFFAVRHRRRFCGWVFILTAAAVAALTIAAARSPVGEPALSLWGNPLESWRFFGLRNHLAAFLAGGLITGGALLALPWWVVLASIGGAAALLGAATLGANFLGVLTLCFGGIVAVLALVARRVRWWHPIVAALVGGGATVAALAADRSKVSHGGRAFATIWDGGVDAALDLVRGRARLNWETIIGPGPLGVVAMVLLVIVLTTMFVWAWRSPKPSYAARAAAAGASAAALASLVIEDSGFYTAGILGVFACVAWGAWTADLRATIRLGRDRSVDVRAGPPPADVPPHDTGDQDDAGGG